MNLGDLDVVETSDVEELEEPERAQDLFQFQADYLCGAAGKSNISFPPRKRIKVSDLLFFHFRHLFSPPSCSMSMSLPMSRASPSLLRAPILRHFGALPHLTGLSHQRQC